nr:hypothetical protein [Paraburkholderia tuberum]
MRLRVVKQERLGRLRVAVMIVPWDEVQRVEWLAPHLRVPVHVREHRRDHARAQIVVVAPEWLDLAEGDPLGEFSARNLALRLCY